MIMKKGDIAVIGIAVMGENLARNLASRGYKVVVNSRSKETVDNFIEKYGEEKFIGAYDYQSLAKNLEKPRKVLMMIKAGKPVDDVIEQLLTVLEPGDIIIDGGNSHFMDTRRRTKYVESKGLLYVGTGVSGGEEGALHGPSIMPGGSKEAWTYVKDILQSIAAKTGDGEVCADWVGNDGAGHFVKMVHNGIEYGDIQLIGETYHLMRDVLKMSNQEMHETFASWNNSELNSYLIEITADILSKKDENGVYYVDQILDAAGQKGTGKWTVNSALDEGVPLTLIGEAVFARSLSAMKDERVEASKAYPKTFEPFKGDKQAFLNKLKQALYAAKIVSYAQGFSLMKQAAKAYKWDLDYGNIALLWRGGCIIRSAFLGKIKSAYDKSPDLDNLLLDDYFKKTITERTSAWREVVSIAVLSGIPVPALGSALSYFDGYTTKNLPANLLQAQRDYFGAHTYERIDQPRGKYFHTNWTGEGGDTSSSTYNA